MNTGAVPIGDAGLRADHSFPGDIPTTPIARTFGPAAAVAPDMLSPVGPGQGGSRVLGGRALPPPSLLIPSETSPRAAVPASATSVPPPMGLMSPQPAGVRLYGRAAMGEPAGHSLLESLDLSRSMASLRMRYHAAVRGKLCD
jgi:hypothetical protein